MPKGYPGRRYYGGCQYVDVVEQLAIDRAKRLFNCAFVNVQPHSGSQANQSVMLALIKPGDTVLGMSLAHGGHLTHGAPPNLSGKWFNAVQYGVTRTDNRIDYDEVERLAKEHKPALIIAGGSAYPRIIDFPRFREIADSVGAFLMVDMAHFAGLVAAGLASEPAAACPCRHHHDAQDAARSARGHGALERRGDRQEDQLGGVPRPSGRPADAHHRRQGGGLRGGAHARLQALHPGAWSTTPRRSARPWSRAGALVSGGTDTHLMLVDLRPKKLTGKAPRSRSVAPTSPATRTACRSIRRSRGHLGHPLGSPAGTTRGFGIAEFQQIGGMIIEVLDGLAAKGDEGNSRRGGRREEACHRLCERYPIYR